MDKVYVLFKETNDFDDNPHHEVIGVYASQEKACEVLENNKQEGSTFAADLGNPIEDCEVEETDTNYVIYEPLGNSIYELWIEEYKVE